MTNGDKLDRILSQEEEILPSSGFTASVMTAVRSEIQAPEAIPFPWKRAVPGFAAFALALLAILASLTMYAAPGAAPEVPGRWASLQEQMAQMTISTGTGWIILGLVVSLLSVKLSSRIAVRSV